jgi:hypothetical protein
MRIKRMGERAMSDTMHKFLLAEARGLLNVAATTLNYAKESSELTGSAVDKTRVALAIKDIEEAQRKIHIVQQAL